MFKHQPSEDPKLATLCRQKEGFVTSMPLCVDCPDCVKLMKPDAVKVVKIVVAAVESQVSVKPFFRARCYSADGSLYDVQEAMLASDLGERLKKLYPFVKVTEEF